MAGAWQYYALGMAMALAWIPLDAAASVTLKPAKFIDIVGWADDEQSDALKAFNASCAVGLSTRDTEITVNRSAWQKACDRAKDAEAAREPKAFFESHFESFHVHHGPKTEGTITGYFVPVIEGSLARDDEYRYPVYAPPKDLKVGVPHLTRKQIEDGALEGRGLELAWVKDPIARYFLHVQGSARLKLPDGRIMNLQYAAKNHQPYTAIGRILIEQGDIAKKDMSMQRLIRWMKENPKDAPALMQRNDAFVFFRLDQTDAMPKGAQGVPLTPRRSLAVDKRVYPYGLPVFLTVKPHSGRTDGFNQLLITQDTGTAITGALRADVFFGQGIEAGEEAGLLASPGSWVLLLPKIASMPRASAD